jgi:Na+/H+ antiporter NhaD/arsenite permease-like protein
VVLGAAGHQRELITVVVLQTAAANLGSMLTPVGNPQNLYLYSYYGMGFGEFLRVTFPVWILSCVLLLAACRLLPKERLDAFLGEEPHLDKRSFRLYLALFAVCLLVVLRVCEWPVMLAVIVAALLLFDREPLIRADFMLLLTFVAFFVFAGNLARIESVDTLLRRMISGHEYLAGVLTSQVISNVPAALLLSGFTENARALLLGVNIGGLGTPIASLASLISMKLYAHSEHARIGRYLAVFLTVNCVLLLLLSGARMLL